MLRGNLRLPCANLLKAEQLEENPADQAAADGNGNFLTDNLNNIYTWSVYGSPSKINSTTLIYDALGRMVEQQNGATNTEILYSQLGKTALMNGSTLVKAFVPLPGGERPSTILLARWPITAIRIGSVVLV